jgi:GPH family glycoside/pentoside/hexuronide:cation symporter
LAYLLIIAGLAALCFSHFPFGRAEHDARLARLGAELAE